MAIKKDKIRASAQKFLQKGQIDKAIREYDRLVKADPKDIRTLLKIGDLQARQGDTSTAADTYQRVAEFYSNQGFFLKAVAVYKQILKLDPGYKEMNLRLGELYEVLGLVSDAIREYETLCAHYEENNQQASFRELLEKVVELDTKNVARQIRLAEAYAKHGMLEEARAAFHSAAAQLEEEERFDDYILLSERIIQFDPSDFEIIRSLGKVYLDANEPRKALNKLQVCFNANPRNVNVLKLLAQAFEQLDQNDKVLAVYRELAKILTNREDYAGRNEILRAILVIEPNDDETQKLLEQSEQTQDAYSAMGSSVNLSDESTVNIRIEGVPTVQSFNIHDDGAIAKLLYETQIYIKYAYYDKALTHLGKVFLLHPSHREARERQRDIFLERNDIAKAVQSLWAMALVSQKEGNLRQARDDLEELLGFEPSFEPAKNLLKEIGPQTDYHPGQRISLGNDDELDLQVQEFTIPNLEMTGLDYTPSLEAATIDLDDAGDDEQFTLGTQSDEQAGDFEINLDFPETSEPTSWSGPQSLDINFENLDIDIDLDDLELEPIEGDSLQAEPNPFKTKAESSDAISFDFDSEQIDEFDITASNQGVDTSPEFHVDEETHRQLEAVFSESDEDELDIEVELPGEDHSQTSSLETDAPILLEALEKQAEKSEARSLNEDLNEVNFFIRQDLLEDAARILTQLKQSYGRHPRLQELEEKLAATHQETSYDQAQLAETLALDAFEAVNLLDSFETAPAPAGSDNISFEDVIDEFEEGIEASQIQSTDYETHYDLGIAYKEMGLYDDAIREFSLSVNSPKLALGSLTMLGLCKLEEGKSEDALAYFLRGLNADASNPTQVVALRYEIGHAYLSQGNYTEATRYLLEGTKIDPTFRDIGVLLEQAKAKTGTATENEQGRVDQFFEDTKDEKITYL